MTQDKEEKSTSKVWFITGGSRGLGRAFTEIALSRGDMVMTISRDITPLKVLMSQYPEKLVALETDITKRKAVFIAVSKCKELFGKIDVVINNAGQFLYGMLEEVTEKQAISHMNVNFFGALWVTQAVIPILRLQGYGHMLQVTSMGATGGFASVGIYGAGKAALDSMSEALAMEVKGFGINVTILQPGGYETELFTHGITSTKENVAYTELRQELSKIWSESLDAPVSKAAMVISKIVDLENPPKKIILGSLAYDQVITMTEARIMEYSKWEQLSREAD